MTPTATHKLHHVTWEGPPKRHGGRCRRCGWTCGEQESRQAVEDEFGKHLQNVARALNKGATSTSLAAMTAERDHYEACAADTTRPIRERNEWERLAKELTARIGDRRPPGEQAELF